MSRLSKAINSKNSSKRKGSFISSLFKDDFEKAARELGYYLVRFEELENKSGFLITGIPAYRITEIKRKLRGETEKDFNNRQMEFKLFDISG